MLDLELKSLPQNAGIYQYFDKNGKLLYVGKAKNLKNRIRSYFIFNPKLQANPKNSLRIQKMIEETTHLEFIATDSEADALILENSFIKQLHPKYNILLRDDKTYPYIYIDFNEVFPRPQITRKIIKRNKIKYFGPFFKGAKDILDALYLYYPLKQKNNCTKPCIFHQINRCFAPCANLITQTQYENILKKSIEALLNPEILIKNLERTMFKLSNDENYEEAAKTRDQINTIKDLKVKIQIDIAKLENFDVFAFATENNIFSVVRFVILNGKIISSNNKTIPLKNMQIDKNEIYKQIILENFNIDTPTSSNCIYVYEDFEDLKLLQDLLLKRFKKNIYIKVAKSGEKRKICELAYKNALLNIHAQNKNNDFELLFELKKFFDLEHIPTSIEIFDNSHLQGVANVGAMVSYKENNFEKNRYRHFHLKHQNDYEQMKEVLTRRVLDFETLSAPDLWIIDGGKALLDLAEQILQSCGANIDVIAISKEKIDSKSYRAKGAAKDKIYTSKGQFLLSTHDKKLQFLQKLRDEAHRFAISFHQKVKMKQDLQSSKLRKLGISDAKIKKLLHFFGNFEEIQKANFWELEELIGKNVAIKIKRNSKN